MTQWPIQFADELAAEWRGRERFVVLQIGLDPCELFLSAWRAWRRDVQGCEQLHFIMLCPPGLRPIAPPKVAPENHGEPPKDDDLGEQLQAAWPPLTPDLHRLTFDDAQVVVLIAPGEPMDVLAELVATVDAFVVDSRGPLGQPLALLPQFYKRLARLAAPQALLALCNASDVVAELGAAPVADRPTDPAADPRCVRAARAAWTTAGFQSTEAPPPSPSPLPGCDLIRARFSPRFMPCRPPVRRMVGALSRRHAVVVGAGLAGCASAWALAEQGWTTTVVDRHGRPAQEASGNPGGLFHGILNAQDGTHARFNRAAALEAQKAVAWALTHHGVAGGLNGLLRLETGLADIQAMRRMLAHTALPPDYVQALDADAASALCGLALSGPAWLYPGGGWVNPAGLANAFLARAGARATLVTGREVAALQPVAGGWRLLDMNHAVIIECDVVVLANAHDALRLLPDSAGAERWPVQRVRGQISMAASGAPGLPSTLVPLTGAGYLLPASDGQTLFGASSQAGDTDTTVRAIDHDHNLAQLRRLVSALPGALPRAAVAGGTTAVNAQDLAGRTGFRSVTNDRLPLIGQVPDAFAAETQTDAGQRAARRPDQPRFVPRLPGLFIYAALGSRGITWAALGAQVLASTITWSPCPLQASLLDAVDPARFLSREVKRRGAKTTAAPRGAAELGLLDPAAV